MFLKKNLMNLRSEKSSHLEHLLECSFDVLLKSYCNATFTIENTSTSFKLITLDRNASFLMTYYQAVSD